MRHIAQKVILFIFLFLLVACSSSEKIETDTAEGAYKLAKEFEEQERFEEAISYYSEIKNKHPYSRYAIEAELRIAEIQFERESFVEAESAYKLFKEFHPSHSKIDYVTFQLAMSYFRQLPETIDRDLAVAKKALLYFEEVVNAYPNSDYAGAAGDHRKKTRRRLARKENYIAEFYFIREMYDSALGRYEGILKEYSNLGLDSQALYGAAVSSHKLKNPEKAKRYYSQLVAKFPKSKETKKAKEEIGNAL